MGYVYCHKLKRKPKQSYHIYKARAHIKYIRAQGRYYKTIGNERRFAEPRKHTLHWQQPGSAKNMERNKNVRNRKRVQCNEVEKKRIRKNNS